MNPETISRRGFFDRVADGMQGAAMTYLLSKELFGVSELRGLGSLSLV